MWFHLVRLVIDCETNKIKFGNKNQYSVKLNKRYYKDWDIYNYLDSTFDQWFKDKAHLFAEKEQVSLVKRERSQMIIYIFVSINHKGKRTFSDKQGHY